jgi:hypothetical protein
MFKDKKKFRQVINLTCVMNMLLTKSKGRSDLPAIVKPTIDSKIDGLVAAILSYDEVARMTPEQPIAPFAILA